MEYFLGGRKFSLSYDELRIHYEKHVAMTDEEFTQNLPSAIHLACVICFFKGLKTEQVLSDIGVVHELAHMLHIPNCLPLAELRELFNKTLLLAP